ncbi:SDR family oxidoreductase [Sphingomonas jatrophae]|uniref:Short-chain dehydrogenase n=1 Tax=Sphingomonas jatrophae TaxID=1166337 RepID=A0A1I6M9V5_9SPHN|nr:hypothetical protein SAMN05192580_3737 [Sphingomonas jatrophae]
MPVMLILGATSDIARAVAAKFCQQGWELLLAGRDLDATESIARDLALRAGRDQNAFASFVFDAAQTQNHGEFWDKLPCCPDAVLCAIGGGGDPAAAQYDFSLAETIMRVNFTGLVPVLLMAAEAFEKRGRGTIIGIGSVAGDRGRAANYVYGSAKAGFATFLAGLSDRLIGKGINVITVKPGPVITRMSEGLSLNPWLTAQPKQVADAVYRAHRSAKQTIYVKPLWRLIMLILVHVPSPIFRRMNLAVRRKG